MSDIKKDDKLKVKINDSYRYYSQPDSVPKVPSIKKKPKNKEEK